MGAAVVPAAAAETKTGFYNIGTADGVTITPKDSKGTAVTSTSEDVDKDGKADTVYFGSDQLEVKYTKATETALYDIFLVEGDSLDVLKKDEESLKKVYYVNGTGKDGLKPVGNTVTFNVLPDPNKLTKNMSMTLFITSDDGKTAVKLPLNYLAGATADFLVGDVNADGKVNSTDRKYLARYVAGWTGAEEKILSKDAADINQDGRINSTDRKLLARYVAGWTDDDIVKWFK